MKITLEINDNTICAFFNSVVNTNTGLTMFSHQIGSNDLEDGNTIKFGNNLSHDELIKKLSKYKIERILIEEATLEDMFLHYYK